MLISVFIIGRLLEYIDPFETISSSFTPIWNIMDEIQVQYVGGLSQINVNYLFCRAQLVIPLRRVGWSKFWRYWKEIWCEDVNNIGAISNEKFMVYELWRANICWPRPGWLSCGFASQLLADGVRICAQIRRLPSVARIPAARVWI